MPRQQPQKKNPFYVLPADAIEYYHDKADEFTQDIILYNVRDKYSITRQQRQGLKAISIYDQVGIRSGHGPGKTAFEAFCAIWFLATREGPSCRVPCTAPTGLQLSTILWPEISKWLSMSLVKEELQWMATKLFHKAEPEGRFATWRTSDRSDNMSGFHGEHMLWLIDEAFGIVDPMVFEVIEGSLTQGKDNKILFAGNPTVINGWAPDAFGKNKADWSAPFGRLFTWSSEDSEIVDQERVAREAVKWGRNSDFFRVRRLGLPPLGNPDAFLQLVDIEKCVNREDVEDGEIELGIDPARFGDDLTSITARKGYYIFDPVTMSRKDDVEIYESTLNLVRMLREKYDYKERIKVKILVTGNWGAGVYDMLKHNGTDNIEAVALIESKGNGNELYLNAISVMWGEFRADIDKWHLPNDPDLIGELSTRKYKIRGGKTEVEPKAEFKKTIKVSPDRSDSLMACITKRAIIKKVFDFWPSEYMAPITVHWDKLTKNTVALVSLWMEKNMKTSAIICLWQAHRGTMFVLAEHVFDNPQPETVIPLLTKIVKFMSNDKVKELVKFQWFGNSIFFDKNTGDLQNMYRRYRPTPKHPAGGIYVRENERYNEPGAIAFVSKLITESDGKPIEDKKLLIDEELGGIQFEMQEWGVEAGKEGYGLARSLCGVVSALHETGQIKPAKVPIKTYTEKSLKAQERMRKMLDDDRLDEINRPGHAETYGKDSWML